MDRSMTFTDPDREIRSKLGIFIPDTLTVPIANVAYQIDSGDSFGLNYSNAITGLLLGFLGGIHVQGKGSSLVETDIGLAKHTEMLTSSEVDVKRDVRNAAYYSSNKTYGKINATTMTVIASMEAANFIYYYPLRVALKVGIPVSAAMAIAGTVPEAFMNGVLDLKESHNSSMDTRFKNWKLNDSVHVYEDFLYERPFVNLLLGDIHTLDTLSKMEPAAREGSALNRNCYYLGDRDSAECAVGLFSKSADLTSTQKVQKVSSLTPLRFKSESDWSKMGVKVDRWERVDGLTPDGELAKNSVPIRHVERYEVPAITVDDWIEKYSFVVDDLMPHRLRQIRLNFNYREEIAWECDVSKDYEANDNCIVYKRISGGEWKELRKEKHPVRKNGNM